MEEEERLETTNETENVETQTTEENEDIELIDSSENNKVQDIDTDAEDKNNENVYSNKKLRDILAENPDLQEEFNHTMQTRLARQKDKFQRETEEKYSRVENLLNAGVGGKDINENADLLEKMLKEQGIDIPSQSKPKYSQKEVEILAKAEADSIIEAGYEEIVEETDRLLKLGYDNMTDRDKIIFKKLANVRKTEEDKKEVRKLGLGDDFLKDEEFGKFIKEFEIPDTMPFSKKFELFQKTKKENKEKVSDPGSLRNNDSKVEKDTFTSEEVDKLTEEQWNDPKIMAKVRRSMQTW